MAFTKRCEVQNNCWMVERVGKSSVPEEKQKLGKKKVYSNTLIVASNLSAYVNNWEHLPHRLWIIIENLCALAWQNIEHSLTLFNSINSGGKPRSVSFYFWVAPRNYRQIEVEHKHDNPVTSLDCVHVHKSVVGYVIAWLAKSTH